MTEYSGSGDPQRSLELLWGLRERPTRGPKARLSVPELTAVAVAIADAEGLAAVSMRRVADELGVSPMSLYTYVPGKAELFDLMLDTVQGETARTAVEGGWRDRLEQVARENAALLHRHPWLLQIGGSRPSLGPGMTAKYDHELRTIDGIGLTDVEMDSILTLVLGYVASAVRAAVDAAQAVRQTGLTDEQWWEKHGPLLAKIADPERFPVATRVGTAAGQAHNTAYDPGHAFEFGLARVLDGIESFIESRG